MTTTAQIGDDFRTEVARILARFHGMDIAAVKVSTMKRVAAMLDEPVVVVCPHCDMAHTFDLVAHLSVPSRDKPLSAAAAVNMRRAVL